MKEEIKQMLRAKGLDEIEIDLIMSKIDCIVIQALIEDSDNRIKKLLQTT